MTVLLTSSRVVLLYGGTWDEREVSTASAREVRRALQEGGLSVAPLRWDPDGWTLVDADDLLADGETGDPLEVLSRMRREGIGVVFNSLHGGPGEDGTVQGLLESAGVAYTGGGVHGSAVSGNKATFRRVAGALGAEVAKGIVVDRGSWERESDRVLQAVAVDLGLPVVVKPLASGSSYGVSKCDDTDSVADALASVLDRDRRVLVERFVAGREISIPCLGTRHGEPPDGLPIVEIEPLTDTGIFDLSAKYEPGRAREIVPAPLDPELAEHLSTLARRIHDQLDLGGASRTDLILGADGPVVLETQTVPGMTRGSLLPLSAESAGLDMTALCRRLLDYAVSVQVSRGAERPEVGSEPAE